MPLSAFNPFRSHASTPQTTGAQDSAAASNTTPSHTSRSEDQISPPPPSFSSSPPPTNPTTFTSADSEPPRGPPNRDLDGVPLDLEEPPPYTPRPAEHIGETTLEQGPNRPFQPPPPRNPQPPPQQHHPVISPQHTAWSQPQPYHPPPSSYGPGSSFSNSGSLNSTSHIVRQFTSSLNTVARNISNNLNVTGLTPQPTGRTQWSSYPGQQAHGTSQPYPPPVHPPPSQNSSHFPPPPRHPLSASASTSELTPPPHPPRHHERRHSSDFAREFYAAGTGEGLIEQPPYHPPPGPPPSSAPATSSSSSHRENSTPNDGRPTTKPLIGHPLLKDGKLLVYPKGYKCEKCLNTGYKNADPLHPCKKCWGKYAKPFSGPLAYSFNNSDPGASAGNSHFQKPLPHIAPRAPPPIPPLVSFEPPPAQFAPGGYMTNHHGGFYGPPNTFPAMSPPAPGTVIYSAGDPRIGGRLCWRCNGKGNVSFMVFERMTCEVCGGVGRTFV